jgi:hypothetical protein
MIGNAFEAEHGFVAEPCLQSLDELCGGFVLLTRVGQKREIARSKRKQKIAFECDIGCRTRQCRALESLAQDVGQMIRVARRGVSDSTTRVASRR